MTYLLDTNVISELRKPKHRSNPHVRGWVQATKGSAYFLSVITVLELEIGVARAERKDSRQGQALRRWLEERVLVAFEHHILPVDLAVVRQAARLHSPDPRPERDALIASTALVYGLTVVTRNVRDFVDTGVRVINPWN